MSLVVAYDAANSQAASRLWWLLTDAGHRRVRVLNGGLAAWMDAGLPTASGPAPSVRPGDFVVRPGQRAQFNGAQTARRSWTRRLRPLLVDVRAAERYSGESEPIDPVAGHIPGAINLPSIGECRTRRPVPRHRPLLRERYSSAGAARQCGAVLRVRDHRRPKPAGAGIGWADGRDLPRLVERVDHRPESARCGRGAARSALTSPAAWVRRT